MSKVAEKKKDVYTLEEMVELLNRIDELKRTEIIKFRKSLNLQFIKYYFINKLDNNQKQKMINGKVMCFNKTDKEYYERKTYRYDEETAGHVFDLFASKKYLIENHIPQLKAEEKKPDNLDLKIEMNDLISQFIK